MGLFANSTSWHSDLRHIIRGCSIPKRSKTMKPSIQTFIEEVESVISVKKEYEYRETSKKMIALLLILVNQNSKSDVTENFNNFHKRISCLKYKTIDRHLGWKKDVDRAEEIWVWKPKNPKTSSTFCYFWPNSVQYKEENQYFPR